MDRRAFIKTTAVAAGVASTTSTATPAGGTPATAKRAKNLRMATFWPRDALALHAASRRLSERLELLSRGDLRISITNFEEDATPQSGAEAIQAGLADVYHACDNWHCHQAPELGFFGAAPPGIHPRNFETWLDFGGGQALWDEAAGALGVKAFLTGLAHHPIGFWSDHELTSTDDLNGVRVFMPGIAGRVAEFFGAQQIRLHPSEAWTALSEGRVNALSWFGPYVDMQIGLYANAPHFHESVLSPPAVAVALGVSQETWNGLGLAERALLQTCATAERASFSGEVAAQQALALDALAKQFRVKRVFWPQDTQSRVRKASSIVLSDLADHSPLAGKIHASLIGFQSMTTMQGMARSES